MEKKRVAIVHDFLMKMGGAERVVQSLLKIYPDADLFTLVYDQNLIEANFTDTKIKGSWLQKFPKFLRTRYRFFTPWLRRAIEAFDLSDYDLVISSSSAFAHGVITNLKTKHVCYYHSPTRYLWDWHYNYLQEMGAKGIRKLVIQYMLSKQRVWDFLAAQRPEQIIANSDFIAGRIKKFYRRDSETLYPPVQLERFKMQEDNKGYYLFVGTLSPYKNVELAIKFFNKIGHNFKVVGAGKQFGYLNSIAEDNIELLGNVGDEKVVELMQNCKAFIFPGEEDFGIAIVEAMACGKPVFAYGVGGAKETVINGKTGWLFEENSLSNFEKCFAEFLRAYDKFKPKEIRKHAEQFAEAEFTKKLKRLVS